MDLLLSGQRRERIWGGGPKRHCQRDHRFGKKTDLIYLPFFRTVEGQVVLAGSALLIVGVVTYMIWRWKQS